MTEKRFEVHIENHLVDVSYTLSLQYHANNYNSKELPQRYKKEK